VRARILLVMKRIALLFTLLCIAAVVSLERPSHAAAGWCWPNCSSYGILSPWTNNSCWYNAAVCSGWGYWYVNGETKTCYPMCDGWSNTSGQILYGFESSDRIRGRFTSYSGTHYIRPADVSMGGYLRAQVTWWSGSASQINVAATG
jgi:hypothetical protein